MYPCFYVILFETWSFSAKTQWNYFRKRNIWFLPLLVRGSPTEISPMHRANSFPWKRNLFKVTRLGTATCRNWNAGPTTNTLRFSKSFSSWSVCFLSCQLTAVGLNSYCFRVQRDVNLSITIGEWWPKWHQGAESSRYEKSSWKYKKVKALSTSFYQNSMLLVIRYVSIPACFR